ncbi:amino acid adenylation domain-containing protein [Rhodospirillum sp. A1_3_36]|uniref:amino acid adenylation domain-containing protein n=1 Tax=Rhodospirillum sp. A1_3_36 TaxID=3391666 RepID=UPI0039A56763
MPDTVETFNAPCGFSGIPLSTARSSVHWPRRATLTLEEPLSLPVPPGGEDGLTLLGAAVAAVLFRYGGSPELSVGIARSADDFSVATLALSLERTFESLVADMARALPEVPVEPETAHNGRLPVIVAAAGMPEPKLRQDATLFYDATTGRVSCDYHSRLFQDGVIRAFFGHVITFATLSGRKGGTPIGAVSYLSGEEERRVHAATCPDPLPRGETLTVGGLFLDQAKAHPDRPAILAKGVTLTHGDLLARASRIAGALLDRGIGPGDRVGICVRPGPDQLLALVGAFLAGGCVVPIDHSFPASRLATIAAMSEPRVILAGADLMETASQLGAVLGMAEALEGKPDRILTSLLPGGGEDPAYLLFTSGSTGAPKGVLVAQRTLVNLILWQNGETPTEGRVTLNRSSMAFDVGLQEIMGTLCFGGALVVATEDERADISAILGLMVQWRVQRVFLPPVALVQIAELHDTRVHDLTTLEDVIVAGERLTVTPHVVQMFRSCPARLINQYGPTETHVATSHELTGSPVRWPLRPPIGRPIANARVHVVDAAGMRCPFGVEGEILIGGALPAIGYLDPVATAERFVADPFPGAAVDGRMYRTGDFGRLGADGVLDFVGRRDDQVKLRGYRIELGDVEANAMALPDVRLAAAVVQKARGGAEDGRLVLFLESLSGGPLDMAALRAGLMACLPQHMVPPLPAMRQLEHLPLSRVGKVDRSRLPEITGGAEGDVGEAGESTRSGLERLWKRFLNLDGIAPDMMFADLGGHSLTAIQLVSAVNQAFGVRVPVAVLLRGTTLERFVAVVEEAIAARAGGGDGPGGATAGDVVTPTVVTLPSGRVVEALHPAEARHYEAEIRDGEAHWLGGMTLEPGAVVVDIGANIGIFSLHMIERFKAGRVLAVEPSPQVAALLRRNLKPHDALVRIAERAVLDRDGVADFTVYSLLSGMSSLRPDRAKDRALFAALIANESDGREDLARALAGMGDDLIDQRMETTVITVPVRRLSSLLRDEGFATGPVDLLKIDVQRGEGLVLDGLDGADWSRVRRVVVEHQREPGDDSLAARLRDQGFSVSVNQHPMHRGTTVHFTTGTRDGR